MKFKVEIEIDWLEDDETVDEVVKQGIMSGVAERLAPQATALAEEMQKELLAGFRQKADEEVNRVLNELWEQPVNQTDTFGDVVKSYPSVREMVKQKFDNYLSEKVDKNGSTTSGHYNSKIQTRFDYLFKERVTGVIDSKLKEAEARMAKAVKKGMDEIEKTMSETIEKRVTGELGNRMSKILKIDELLLPEPNGKSS